MVATNCFLVAPTPPWSRKSRRLRLGLENYAVSISVWKVWKWLSLVAPVAPFPVPQVRAVSTLVAKFAPEFFGRKSLEMENFSRATSASFAKVATDHHGRDRLEMPDFDRENLDMPIFGLESLDMPKICRKSLDMNLELRPG